MSLNDIHNYYAYSESLITGGQPSENELTVIAEAGYQAVVNLGLHETDYALADEGQTVLALGMRYYHIPVIWTSPSVEGFDDFCERLDALKNDKIFVHCAANKRVSVFVALYRIIRGQAPSWQVLAVLYQIWQPNPCWLRFIEQILLAHEVFLDDGLPVVQTLTYQPQPPKNSDTFFQLRRRGVQLGWLTCESHVEQGPLALEKVRWDNAHPVFLSRLVIDQLAVYQDSIQRSMQLMKDVLVEQDCGELLAQAPYAQRLSPSFECLSSLHDLGDRQEIEKLEFDALQDETLIAEDLWIKVSWLSFEEDDDSLRFRFSFGMEGYEDVAADLLRQKLVGQLQEAVFPESVLVTQNEKINHYLRSLLDLESIEFVERIVYFNAPNGGAQFHHDVERGHKGVLFAQLYGRTAWLCLPRRSLIRQIQNFLDDSNHQRDLAELFVDSSAVNDFLNHYQQDSWLSNHLEEKDKDVLDCLINRTPAFTQQLVEHGFGHMLSPGDIILLPQADFDHCAWHSVFCIDEQPGLALSFAIREGE